MKKLLLVAWCVINSSILCVSPYRSADQARKEWQEGRRHFVIVTATYNNALYCIRNIDWALKQGYDDYEIVVTDDNSTDGTADLIEARIREFGLQDRVTLIRNTARRGAMANQYTMIHEYCNPTDIVVIYDGDDFFLDGQVLSYLSTVYADPNVWLTYGQFQVWPSGERGFCVDMPRHVIESNAFRRFVHIPSHLRTFYAGLFHKIKKEDLLERDGRWLRMDADIAAMFPMIEMAREGHFRFISKVLLQYNAENSLNDHKVSKKLQRQLDLDIRSRTKYDALNELF